MYGRWDLTAIEKPMKFDLNIDFNVEIPQYSVSFFGMAIDYELVR